MVMGNHGDGSWRTSSNGPGKSGKIGTRIGTRYLVPGLYSNCPTGIVNCRAHDTTRHDNAIGCCVILSFHLFYFVL